MNQVVQRKYVSNINLEDVITRLATPLNHVYEVLISKYSQTEQEEEQMNISSPVIDQLQQEFDSVRDLYLTFNRDDGNCEFLFGIERLISEIQHEIMQIKSLGENYVMDDWTAVVIYQLKLVLDIIDEETSPSGYNLGKLKKPLIQIYEDENRGNLFNRVLRRFYSKKTAEEKYLKMTSRSEILEGIQLNSFKPKVSAKKYESPGIAANQPYTQIHMR